MLDLHPSWWIESSLFNQVRDAHEIQLPVASAGAADSPGRVTYGDGAVSSQARSATLIGVSTFTASTALPYEHLEPATAGLRAELRQKALRANVHQMPMWDTFEVTGPHEFTDLRGRRWFEYRATVSSRAPFDSAAKVSPPGRVRTESE